MSSLVHTTRHASRLTRQASLALLLSVFACSRSPSTAPVPSGGKLSETERIAHVLSRLTFGARTGDAAKVKAMGIDRWIDQQLRPESIPDTALARVLVSNTTWSQPTANVSALTAQPARPVATFAPPLTNALNFKDSAAAKLAQLKLLTVRVAGILAPNDAFFAGKIIHAQVGERQLQEVISDFWENHFSLYSGKMPSQQALILWDRDAIRPYALGKFRDLLGAVAHSPAMLFYLDNHLSTSRGLNENYARELLELHTMGVDNGYTQKDVVEVARALTGWTIDRPRNPNGFVFRANLHDTGPKVVLGHTLEGGRGIEDGEEVLDIIARHPSTAHYISLKLARRLVSDDPPASLVNRAAATFTKTDGDIAQVVRTIVTSPEFYSREAFRAKVKTPFELVVSVRRAFDLPADTTAQTSRLIGQLGQALFSWQTPDGWPERGNAWINSGTIYKRLKFAGDVANGTAGATMPLDRSWRDWSALSSAPLDQQVEGVVKDILGGCAESATREAMLGGDANAGSSYSTASSRRLRDLLAIALGSPEFQRR